MFFGVGMVRGFTAFEGSLPLSKNYQEVKKNFKKAAGVTAS
jgi:hypothetical protein